MGNPEALAEGLRIATEGNAWAYKNGVQAAEAADVSVDPHQPAWDALDAASDMESQWLDGKAAYLRVEMKGDNDIQSRIGIGGQYVVYRLPGNRVLKVAHSAASARKELVRQGHNFDSTPLEIILTNRDRGTVYVQQLCEQYVEAQTLFGNPVFNGDLGQSSVYEQDELTIPGAEFNNMTEENQKEYINKYIESQLRLWSFGCSEATFNFQVNAGLNSKGDMVVSDFGEMDFSKDVVASRIASTRWIHAWGVKSLSPDMREWANERFSQEMTIERIRALWCARV